MPSTTGKATRAKAKAKEHAAYAANADISHENVRITTRDPRAINAEHKGI